jgi:hypothetical protein
MKTTQEQIKVMQHFANGGVVEYVIAGYNGWLPTTQPSWDWIHCDYRVGQPKKKQVKMLCWKIGSTLAWYEEEGAVSITETITRKRVPLEDKIIEVEE